MIPAWQMEAYERLRTEIVKSTVSDLQKALRKSDRIGAVCEEQVKLEAWLLSGWGQLLSGNNGEYIISKCHENYKTKAHKNGKWQMPQSAQNSIIADYKNGMPRREILKKYGITVYAYEYVLRGLRSET